jgi:hypothetical protein
MKRLLLVVTAAFTIGMTAEPLLAQTVPHAPAQQIPPLAKTVSLAGPRYGFTFLDDGIVAKLKSEDIEVKNGISQFGWQFERQFYSKEGTSGCFCWEASIRAWRCPVSTGSSVSARGMARSSESVRTSRRSALRLRLPPASPSAREC